MTGRIVVLPSWMYAHNESGNIWTHLAGAGAAVGILICICSGMPLCTQCMLTAADRAVIASYAAGAVVCLSSSVIYHTFNCCSKTSYACCKRLDHAGVLCLLVASDLPMIYFGFYGKPLLQSIYLGLVLAITVAAGFVMLAKQRTDSRFHVTRQLIFIGLVAVGWSHMVHEVAMKGGMSTEEGRASAWCWVSSFGFYAAGFAFFLTKFPERAWPGAFDLWVSPNPTMRRGFGISTIVAAEVLAAAQSRATAPQKGISKICSPEWMEMLWIDPRPSQATG